MLISRDYFALILSLVLVTGCKESSSSETSNTNPSTSLSTPTSLQQVADMAIESDDVSGIILFSQTGEKAPQSVGAGIDINNAFLFKIASISKLFMAVAATKLANENTLNLQDPVATWLPELSTTIANIESATLEHLIKHRSGIPDFDSQPGFSWDQPHTSQSATLDLIKNVPADFAPNARYEYSNSNYLLLGMVMDRALGFSHEQFIQSEILNKLAMDNSYLQQADAPQSALIAGFWDGRNKKAQEYKIPGGSMIASAQDIGVFIAALNRGTLLSDEESALYPYFYEHSGWLPGYQSIARYDSYSDTVIIVFTANTGGDSGQVTEQTFNQVRNLARQ